MAVEDYETLCGMAACCHCRRMEDFHRSLLKLPSTGPVDD